MWGGGGVLDGKKRIINKEREKKKGRMEGETEEKKKRIFVEGINLL